MGEREKHNTEDENLPDKEMPKALFKLGRIVMTPGAQITIEAAQLHPVQFLARHVTGDWGNLPVEDIEENERSLKHGWRIFSAYDLETGGRVYAITVT